MAATWRSARAYFWPLILVNVFASAYATGADPERMLFVSVALSALASFGFLVNDLTDRSIDLVNAAGHFEHSDSHTLRTARLWAVAFAALGLGAAAVAGRAALAIVTVMSVSLLAYSPVLRRIPLLPNVVTAGLATSPLWMPMVLAASPGAAWQWWLVAGFAVMLVGREVAMDVRDRAGDRAGGRRTAATALGSGPSAALGVVFSSAGAAGVIVAVLIDGDARPAWTSVGAASLASVILGFVILSALGVRRASVDGLRAAIQRHVIRTRFLMALVPLLILLLAWRD